MSNFAKKHQILSQLSDGEFYSGQALGESLGISRAAVGKHIKQLEDIGLDIFSVTGKGYKLAAPLRLLDETKITANTNRTSNDWLEVHHVIDSTNDHMLEQIRAGQSIYGKAMDNGHTVVAECQTAGRGRRGRSWISPFGSHIYFSYLWHLDGIGQAMGLSVAVGLALRETIAEFIDSSSKATLKWPNDVYVDGKKIAGILVELEGQADGPCEVVIGIGINVNMPAKSAEQIDQPWTDLSSYSDETVDRNLFIAKLCNSLYRQMEAFAAEGLSPLVSQWNEHDYFYQQDVKLIMGNHETHGVCQGIDRQGGLVLTLKDGNTRSFYGGEISVRKG